MTGLRARITGLMLLLSLSPLVVAYLMYQDDIKTFQQVQSEKLLETARAISANIDSFISGHVRQLEVLSQEIGGSMETSESFGPLDHDKTLKKFKYVLETYDDINLLILADNNNKVQAALGKSINKEYIDVNYMYTERWSHQSWFRNLLQQDGAVSDTNRFIRDIIRVDKLLSNDRDDVITVLPVVIPVLAADGEKTGLLTAFIKMQAIEDILYHYVKSPGQTDSEHKDIILADRNSKVITSIQHDNNTIRPGLILPPYLSSRIYKAKPDNTAGNINDAAEWYIDESFYNREKRFVGYYRPVRQPGGISHDWVVLVYGSANEIFSEIDQVNFQFLAIVAVSVILVAITGLWAGGVLTGPVVSMTDAVKRLRKGEQAGKIAGVGRKDELGQLANSISSLQYYLNDRQELLTKQALQYKELLSARQQLNDLMDTASEAMMVINNRGTIERVNPAAEALFRYQPGDMNGLTVETLIPERYRDHISFRNDYMRRPVYRPMSQKPDIVGLKKDGEEFFVNIILSPIESPEGVKILAYISDETEKRKYQEELEQRVALRTQELRVALESADQATRAKSAFLATMSHEIRTPLNGVIGMVELLRRSSLNANQQDMLDVVRESSFSLLRIINDILDFSKIEAGKLEMEAIPVSLQQLLERVGELLGPNALSGNVQLVSTWDGKLPAKVIADPVRLRQILYNLTGNAIKFTPEHGTVFIQIVMKELFEDRVKISINVEDTGVGMSKELMQKLFEPFTQADESTTRRFGGTGLGLTICLRLVEMMDGKIEVDSEPDKGSRFHVHLELPVLEPEPVPFISLAGKNILIATNDDNTLIGKMRVCIESTGANVIVRDTLEDTINAIETMPDDAPVDAVLICVQWSVEQRYDYYTRIYQKYDRGHNRIVFMQTQDDHNEMPGTIRTSLNPVNINEVCVCLAQAVDQSIPVREQAETVDTGIKLSDRSETPVRTAAGGVVLLAEDNVINQEVITLQLETLGYQVVTANDGKQALELWRQQSFDLVLTDCNMPEMDGYEFTRAIRQAEKGQHSHTPVIAITANAMQEEKDHCLAAGMDDVITKPVELKPLEDALSKWMAQQSDRDNGQADKTTSQHTAGAKAARAPVNLDVLSRYSGSDDPALQRQLLEKFIHSTENTLDELAHAIERQALDRVVDLSHQVKSSAHAVGATTLAELCQSIEQAGRAERRDEVYALILAVREEFNRVRASTPSI